MKNTELHKSPEHGGFAPLPTARATYRTTNANGIEPFAFTKVSHGTPRARARKRTRARDDQPHLAVNRASNPIDYNRGSSV